MKGVRSLFRIGAVLVGVLVAASSQAAHAFVIARTSSSVFYIDSSVTPLVRGTYVSYQITNDSVTAYPDVWAKIDTFTGGVISLAPSEDGLVHLGPMGVNETKTAFFYLQAGGVTSAPQSHTVRVFPTRPPATELASASFSMTVEETIQAAASKVETVVNGPNPPSLGGTVTMTVTGETGTIGAAKVLSFSPASYLAWPAQTFRLESSSIMLSGANTGTFNGRLLIPPSAITSTANTDYTAVYVFRAVGTRDAPTTVSPLAYISSGTQVKHDSTGAFGSILPILPPSNTLILSKIASPTSLSAAGTVTYRLRLTNAGASDVVVDDAVDVLPTSPGSVTYVPGSSAFNGVGIADPSVSGSTLTWVGALSVPAGTFRDLTCQVQVPGTEGTYVNSAVAHIGTVQIDTTQDPSDNAPATASVVVQLSVARLLLAKRITAINGTPVTGFADDPADPNDTHPYWPVPNTTYLRGGITSSQVRPGDEVEYTVYFLSAGNTPLTDVTLCDVLPPSTFFIDDAFNGLTPTDGGVSGADSGIALALSSAGLPTEPTVYLSNVADGDRGQFFPPGTTAPPAANPPGFTSPLPGSLNVSGVVCVEIVRSPVSLPNATAAGVPPNAYGFVRFRVRVN